MKYIKIILSMCVLVAVLSACGQQSAIQEATGANAEQGRAIESVLENAGIEYELINEARHNLPDAEIPDDCKVYNLVDRDGQNYFLVLNGANEAVAIMDSDETLVWGDLA